MQFLQALLLVQQVSHRNPVPVELVMVERKCYQKLDSVIEFVEVELRHKIVFYDALNLVIAMAYIGNSRRLLHDDYHILICTSITRQIDVFLHVVFSDDGEDSRVAIRTERIKLVL